MLINKKLIHYNFSSRNGTRIAYIVVHDTAILPPVPTPWPTTAISAAGTGGPAPITL